MKKEIINLKEQGWLYVRIWKEEREGATEVIIISKIKEIVKKLKAC